jgi:hypothetical protein
VTRLSRQYNDVVKLHVFKGLARCTVTLQRPGGEVAARGLKNTFPAGFLSRSVKVDPR